MNKTLFDLLSEKSIIFHTFQNYNIVCCVALYLNITLYKFCLWDSFTDILKMAFVRE